MNDLWNDNFFPITTWLLIILLLTLTIGTANNYWRSTFNEDVDVYKQCTDSCVDFVKGLKNIGNSNLVCYINNDEKVCIERCNDLYLALQGGKQKW